MPLKIFISHSHSERGLAMLVQELLNNISLGAIKCWASSDQKPHGGFKPGDEWRDVVDSNLSESDYTIAILTPSSFNRPWVMWETGMAAGIKVNRKKGGIIPIVFSMSPPDFESPVKVFQIFMGEEEASMRDLCRKLVKEAKLKLDNKQFKNNFKSYSSKVQMLSPTSPPTDGDKEFWMRKIEGLIEADRSPELVGIRSLMYTSFGQKKPISLGIHDLLSQAFLDDKKPKLALKEVEFALSLSSTNIPLLHRKGLILIELKRYHDGLELINELARANPAMSYNPEIAGLKGRIFKELYRSSQDSKALNNAIKSYQKGFKQDPYSYYCGVNLVNLLIQQGDLARSKKMAKKVLKICLEIESYCKTSFWLDYTIGELSLVCGNTSEAETAYKNASLRTPAPNLREIKSATKSLKQLAHNQVITKTSLKKIRKVISTK